MCLYTFYYDFRSQAKILGMERGSNLFSCNEKCFHTSSATLGEHPCTQHLHFKPKEIIHTYNFEKYLVIISLLYNNGNGLGRPQTRTFVEIFLLFFYVISEREIVT